LLKEVSHHDVPHHALSVRTVKEMWRYIAQVGILVLMNGFNSLKCSVTPDFLLIDRFLYRLSTFDEKLIKTICVVELCFFSTFLPTHHRILLLRILALGVGKSPFQRLSLTKRMTLVQIIYLTDPLK